MVGTKNYIIIIYLCLLYNLLNYYSSVLNLKITIVINVIINKCLCYFHTFHQFINLFKFWNNNLEKIATQKNKSLFL